MDPSLQAQDSGTTIQFPPLDPRRPSSSLSNLSFTSDDYLISDLSFEYDEGESPQLPTVNEIVSYHEGARHLEWPSLDISTTYNGHHFTESRRSPYDFSLLQNGTVDEESDLVTSAQDDEIQGSLPTTGDVVRATPQKETAHLEFALESAVLDSDDHTPQSLNDQTIPLFASTHLSRIFTVAGCVVIALIWVSLRNPPALNHGSAARGTKIIPELTVKARRNEDRGSS
ncbi:hypothetical protein ONZ45_g13675 [Pleurotus djamor]|nr:hypothetical protein ONZ45_g13675 [Pleurotus djamor]